MTELDVSEILNQLGSHPAIAQAIRERLQHSTPFGGQFSPFSFAIASTDLPMQMYDFFRPTPWFLVAVPDPYFGEGKLRASIRRKQVVRPRPDFCFHATPTSNQRSVEQHGLLPGISLGREGRCSTFADSPYYIYASLSVRDAREWCERFEEADFLIYPIRCGAAGIDLFVDPCSVNTSTNTVSGYIIDAIHVPRSVLGTAIRV